MKYLLVLLFVTVACFSGAKEFHKKKIFDREEVNFEARLRQFKKYSLSFEKQHPFTFSDKEIDIFIPVIEKDLDVLPYTIGYARKNLLHTIKNIYLIAPNSEKIKSCSQKLGCIFIDEATILPFTVQEVDYIVGDLDRRGWLFQQMLKLNADMICKSESILILDADTLLVRPQSFFSGEKVILNCSEERYLPYRSMYRSLIQEDPIKELSFVAHCMIFQKQKLKALKNHIENLHGKKWYEAIFFLIDKKEFSGFSEYETYGQFVSQHYPEEFIELYFFNLALSKDRYLKNVVNGSYKINRVMKSCSFHSWMDSTTRSK